MQCITLLLLFHTRSQFWFCQFSLCCIYFLTLLPSVFLAHTLHASSFSLPIRELCPHCFISLVTFVSLHFVRNDRHSERKSLRQAHFVCACVWLCVLTSECSLIKTAVPLSPDDTSKNIQGSKHANIHANMFRHNTLTLAPHPDLIYKLCLWSARTKGKLT